MYSLQKYWMDSRSSYILGEKMNPGSSLRSNIYGLEGGFFSTLVTWGLEGLKQVVLPNPVFGSSFP